MATSRLRKTFRYPDDSDNEPEELDEEHQERLIADLHEQDAARNDFYQKAFVPIPLLAAAFYLVSVFITSSARQRLLALLSLSSLLTTTYIWWFQPLKAPDKKGKKAFYLVEAENGPIQKYLVSLNAGLACLLAVAAVVSWRKGSIEDAWREALPGCKCRDSCWQRLD